MKFVASVFFALFFVLILSTSCERCVQCTRSIQGNLTNSVERCGTIKEINDYEQLWRENTDSILGGSDPKCFEVY